MRGLDAEAAAQELVDQSEDSLYAALGARLRILTENPAVGAQFHIETATVAGLQPKSRKVLAEFGRRYFATVSRLLYGLLCGSGNIEVKSRRELLGKLKLGRVAFVTALSQMMVTHLALMPAIAIVLASLIMNVFVDPAGKIACEVWRLQMDDGGASSRKQRSKSASSRRKGDQP
jgi:hypothetical protein